MQSCTVQSRTVNHDSHSSSLLPVGAAIAAMLFIQAGASIIKGLFPVVGTQGATVLRLTLATIMMFVIWRPWRVRVRRERWPWIVAYGIVLGAMNSLFYAALSRIPLGIAVSLEFAGPLGLALLGSRRALDFLWVLLAVCGIYLLLPVGDRGGSLNETGVVLALGAGLCWALYIVFGKRAGDGGSGPAVVYGSLVGMLAVLPFGAAQALPALSQPHVLMLALAVALLSSAIPYSLEMIAMTRLPARIFGVLMSVEPGIGALVGFALLSERLSAAQLLAVALIIAASVGTVSSHAATRRGELEQVTPL
ncbi:MAG: EamA family transporter [Proteobacteria bacterium]|nr:EamA family transporter [Pseudomonadota bacterium]